MKNKLYQEQLSKIIEENQLKLNKNALELDEFKDQRNFQNSKKFFEHRISERR